MANLSKNCRRKNCFKVSTIAFFFFLIIILMSNSVFGAEFDNKKTFDDKIGKYGMVTIDNWFGYGNTLTTLELKENTDVCAFDCSMETEIIMFKDGVLIDDIKFMTLKEDNSWIKQPIESYKFYIKTGEQEINVDDYETQCDESEIFSEKTQRMEKLRKNCQEVLIGTHKETEYLWKEYNLGDDVDAGNYYIKLEGRKKGERTVDWQITSQGKLIDDWALWEGQATLGTDLMAYYSFSEGSGTRANNSVNSKYFNGTLINTPTWTAGLIGWGLDFDRTNNEYVNCSGTPQYALRNFSASIWVKIDDDQYDEMNYFTHNNAFIIRDRNTTGTHFIDFIWEGVTTSYEILDIDEWIGQWKHIVVQMNSSTLQIYLNGSLRSEQGSGGAMSGTTQFQIGSDIGKDKPISGIMDEVGLWNRSLSQAEIDALYNSGYGISFDDQTVITLDNPSNNSFSIDDPQNFTATILHPGSLVNATFFAWNSVGTIVNETTILVTGLTINTSNFSISNLPTEKIRWNVLACYNDGGDITCISSQNNFTLNYGLEQIFETFNSTVIETSNQNFILNLDILSGFNVQKGSLIYDDEIFSGATITSLADNYNISRSITIPQGVQGFSSENRTFVFNVTLANDISGATSHFLIGEDNQTVNELSFGFCDGSNLDVPMANFTMVNELTNIELNASKNATTFQATFLLGLDAENQIKNLSFSNLSTNVSRFNFCTTETTNVFTVNMNAFYTANGFVDKNHFLTNAILSNNTNEITLFMMPSSDGVEFFIDIEEDLFPLTGATINIAKFFVGEGVFKTTEIDVTDGDGRITAFLDLNKDYRFTIIKDGVLLAIQEKRAICEAAPCELTLSITGDAPDIYSGFTDIFAQQVLYNLSYDPNLKRVTFEFVDITGLATSFRMDIRKGLSNGTGELISTQTLFTSSGQMTFNHTETSGDFTANILISRSPNQLIDYIKYIIADNAIVLGVLGLFVAFLIVITIIFGFAFHPPMLIMSIPLSLTLVKLMQIISISNGAIVVIYLLAIVATGFISR